MYKHKIIKKKKEIFLLLLIKRLIENYFFHANFNFSCFHDV